MAVVCMEVHMEATEECTTVHIAAMVVMEGSAIIVTTTGMAMIR